MSSISTYFVKNPKDIISKKECMVTGQKFRFTMLTDRLIRLA